MEKESIGIINKYLSEDDLIKIDEFVSQKTEERTAGGYVFDREMCEKFCACDIAVRKYYAKGAKIKTIFGKPMAGDGLVRIISSGDIDFDDIGLLRGLILLCQAFDIYPNKNSVVVDFCFSEIARRG